MLWRVRETWYGRLALAHPPAHGGIVSRLRIDTKSTDTTRVLQNVQEGGVVDVDYGVLTGDNSFRREGTLQLSVLTARRSDNTRTLVCRDQHNRRVIVTYYQRYKTAYVEVP